MKVTRREFIAASGAAGLGLIQPAGLRASAPTAPVAIARCPDYGPAFLAATEKLFDQLGGMGRLVKGKTVTIKINMTGEAGMRLDHMAAGRTTWTHPRSVGTVVHLLDKAGARRIRVAATCFRLTISAPPTPRPTCWFLSPSSSSTTPRASRFP